MEETKNEGQHIDPKGGDPISNDTATASVDSLAVIMGVEKSGSRNNAGDRERIREARQHAREIDRITQELEPTDSDDEMMSMEERIQQMADGKALRFKIRHIKAAGQSSVAEFTRPAMGDAVKRMRPMGELVDPGYRTLGVPFSGPLSGRDWDGEAFTENTDIWLQEGDAVNLSYYHGFGPERYDDWQNPPVLIGRAIYLGLDERGHWFQPMLDPEEPLAMRVMIAPENIRASSGAVGHLCRMGMAGLWDVWPVGELALFDTNEWRQPANDFAVCEPKQPKKAECAAPEVTTEVTAAETAPIKMRKHEEMIEMAGIENTQAQGLDVAALAATLKPVIVEAVQEEMKALWNAEPETKSPAPFQGKNVNLNLKYGEGDPDPAEDFLRYLRTGQGRIKKHQSVAELPVGPNGMMVKAALQEGADDEGGYLVPAGELGRIIEKRDEAALAPKLGVATFSTDRDVFNIPTEGTAMTKFTIVAEEGDVSAAENEPTFGQAATTLYKFQKMIKLSEEILEDYNSGLESFLTSGIGRSWAITDNYYLQLGNGTTAPQGVFVGGTAGLTLDAAAAIGAAEVPELIGKLKEAYLPGAAMLMKRTTKAYLAGLTGSQFVFAQAATNPLMDSVSATIGYPVYGTEDAAAIGAGNKSMLFGNFGFYGIVRNRSLQIKRFVELYGATGQIGIRATYRMGAKVLQAEALQYATHPTA